MAENFLKAVPSICPECHAVISANLSKEDGMVVMRKSCPHHGDYQDVYWPTLRNDLPDIVSIHREEIERKLAKPVSVS